MSNQKIDSVIQQAQVLIKQGQTTEAVALLHEVCDKSNQSPMHWYTFGVAHAESGDIAAAAQAFEQALEYSPSNLMVLTSLGRAYNNLQKYKQSADYLTQALTVNPSHKPAIMLLITAYIAMQNTQQAEKMCNAVYQVEPNNIEILLQLALIRKSQNKFDEAIVFFDKALAIKPNAVRLLVNKGLVLQAKGQIDEAIGLFQLVTQLSPTRAQPWHVLAMALLVKADLSQAIECLKKAFELDPVNIESGRQLAQALRHVGRTDECEFVCKKILEVDPKNAEALFFQNAFSQQRNNVVLERVPADVTRQMYKGANIGKNFDDKLKHVFEYKAPDVLNTAVREAMLETISHDASANKIDILELGCGSGLCGSRFTDIANLLIGTDISPDMLEAAKDKQAYTELYEADLVDALDKYRASMDLIIAMDVLCYFGDLTDIFKRCFKALGEKGIFAFSVVKPKTEAIWELQVQGHFVHSLEHLQQVAENTGFKQVFAKELPLRRELDEDQYGYVCLYQKV